MMDIAIPSESDSSSRYVHIFIWQMGRNDRAIFLTLILTFRLNYWPMTNMCPYISVYPSQYLLTDKNICPIFSICKTINPMQFKY